jgi:hypothetical protein
MIEKWACSSNDLGSIPMAETFWLDMHFALTGFIVALDDNPVVQTRHAMVLLHAPTMPHCRGGNYLGVFIIQYLLNLLDMHGTPSDPSYSQLLQVVPLIPWTPVIPTTPVTPVTQVIPVIPSNFSYSQ